MEAVNNPTELSWLRSNVQRELVYFAACIRVQQSERGNADASGWRCYTETGSVSIAKLNCDFKLALIKPVRASDVATAKMLCRPCFWMGINIFVVCFIYLPTKKYSRSVSAHWMTISCSSWHCHRRSECKFANIESTCC